MVDLWLENDVTGVNQSDFERILSTIVGPWSTLEVDFVHPLFAVKEKVVDIPYGVIFEYTSLPEVT
jgi:hypothetical protein